MLRVAAFLFSLMSIYFVAFTGQLFAQGFSLFARGNTGPSPLEGVIMFLAVVALTIGFIAVFSRFKFLGRVFLLIIVVIFMADALGYLPSAFFRKNQIPISKDDLIGLLAILLVIATFIALYRYGKSLPLQKNNKATPRQENRANKAAVDDPVISATPPGKKNDIKSPSSPFDRGYD
jgi:hypothetical protein